MVVGWIAREIGEAIGLVVAKISGLATSEQISQLNIFYEFIPYAIQFAAIILYVLQLLFFGFFGVYAVMTALIMVFSIQKNPMRMFSTMFDRLITFNGYLFRLFIEISTLAFRVLQIAVTGITNIIPFT